MQTETVTVIRAGESTERDRYGNPLPGPAAETDLPGCLIAQASSAEPVEVGRAAVITTTTVYAPPGADVRSSDRLRVRGELYEVDGDPAQWPGAGVVVAIKRAEG